MRLAVVIVNYKVRDLLRTCLASVQASAALTADKLSVDIIVIDNASHDGSADMVAADFPDVNLIALDENIGFTGANNLALTKLGFNTTATHLVALSPCHLAPPDHVLLLNPDTEVVGDALWQMVDFLESNPSAGICGANLVYGDGSFQHGAFHFPSLAQVAIDLFPLPYVRGMHRLHDSPINGRYPAALWQGSEPFPVDFVLGAALMARAEAISDVGGLDDEYFMYCEEMDWCLRMKHGGWPVYAVPGAQVIHYAGQSSQQVRWPAFERLWRSRFRFYAKHSDRYPVANQFWLRRLVRTSFRLRAASAYNRFAAGAITGIELREELAAYDAVLKI